MTSCRSHPNRCTRYAYFCGEDTNLLPEESTASHGFVASRVPATSVTDGHVINHTVPSEPEVEMPHIILVFTFQLTNKSVECEPITSEIKVSNQNMQVTVCLTHSECGWKTIRDQHSPSHQTTREFMRVWQSQWRLVMMSALLSVPRSFHKNANEK